MAKIWRDQEVNEDCLRNLTIGVIGYGSQGSAQAQNLRDSGRNVIIGTRQGHSQERAISDGFSPVSIEEASEQADVLALLLPEHAHKQVIENSIDIHAKQSAYIVFAHGYTMTYSVANLRDDLRPLLVAPKAIGQRFRELYLSGDGPACLVAAPNGGMEIALAYAKSLGCGRSAIIESTFQEETETDLFGEQAVLCGGMPFLALAAFETLVEAGYQPEVAYFECLYEIKLIADMMVEHGVHGMLERISDTARYGALTVGPRIASGQLRSVMKETLARIRDGSFASSFSEEQEKGMPHVTEKMQALAKNGLDKYRP